MRSGSARRPTERVCAGGPTEPLSLGMDSVQSDLDDFALEITVASSSADDRVDAMLAAWAERCPIYLPLLKPNAIELTTQRAA